MMTIRLLQPAVLLSCLLLVAGCASDPPNLVALPPAPPANHVAVDPASLLLQPVRVPGYLDGLNVVVGRRGGVVVLAGDTEWAERLDDGATRVLAAALSARLGPGNLLIEGDGRIPDADLSVEIIRMDPEPGQLRLEARWSLVGGRGEERPVRAGEAVIEIPMAGSLPDQVATATTLALAQLADTLAAAAVAFPARQGGRF